ncbi:MAG TPA: hypothetical protein DCO65_02195 [Spartobacteria bacterium]|nr:hypothetical protein [Spartobacteria bacterium]
MQVFSLEALISESELAVAGPRDGTHAKPSSCCFEVLKPTVVAVTPRATMDYQIPSDEAMQGQRYTLTKRCS